MFSKTRIRIPQLGSLQVGDMLLTDARDLRHREYTDAQLAPLRDAKKKLQAWVTMRREGTLTCASQDTVQVRYSRELAIYQSANRDATVDDFEAVYNPTYDDSEVDPRLGLVSFTVSQGDRFVGLFNLYNLRIVSDDRTKLSITASPSPSFETSRGYMNDADVGDVMLALMDRDIGIIGSETVCDLVGWDFPTRPDMEWGQQPFSLVVLAKLASKHSIDYFTRDGKQIPTRARRR